RTSKIHALADDRGRPVAFALTPGNVADVVMAIPLLGAIAKPKRLLADKAYDADSLRRWLEYPYRSSDFWRPRAIGLQEGVCENDELSHDCGQRDLCRLSGFDEVSVFGPH